MDCSLTSRFTSCSASRPPKRLVTFLAVRTAIIWFLLFSCGLQRSLRIYAWHKLLYFVQFKPPPLLRPQTFWPHQHHDDQQSAIDQVAEFRELAQQFRSSYQ